MEGFLLGLINLHFGPADKIVLTVGLRFAIESNHHKQSIEITQCQ